MNNKPIQIGSPDAKVEIAKAEANIAETAKSSNISPPLLYKTITKAPDSIMAKSITCFFQPF